MASKAIFGSLWLCIPAKTKTNIQKILFVVAVILSVSRMICAQAPMPEMISYASKPGMPDVVNTSSLNVHLEIPLFYKKVKGIDVAYGLNYDSNNDITGEVVGSGGVRRHLWLDRLKLPPGAGQMTYEGIAIPCWTNDSDVNGGSYAIQYQGYGFSDANGIWHPFDQMRTYDSRDCDRIDGEQPHVLTGYATDGSGYWMSVNDGEGTATIISPSGIEAYNGNGSLVLNAAWPAVGSDGARVNTYDDWLSWAWPVNSIGGPIGDTTVYDPTGAPAFSVHDGYPSEFSVSYTDSNGSQQTVHINFQQYTLRTNFQVANTWWAGQFGHPVIYDLGPSDILMPSSVVYPDGTSYVITYEETPGYPGNTTGRIASLKLPSGGTISYTYGGPHNGLTTYPYVCDGTNYTGILDHGPDVLTRTTQDGTTTYSRAVSVIPGTAVTCNAPQNHVTTTVTYPDSAHSQTVLDSTYGTYGIYFETKKQVFQGAAGGTPLLTTMHCYNGATGDCTNQVLSNSIITQDALTTTLDNGQSSQMVTYYDSVHRVTKVDEYDFDASAPTRSTTRTYAALRISPYTSVYGEAPSIIDHPNEEKVVGGSGNLLKKTTYGYDVASNGTSHGNLTDVYQQIDSSGATAHSVNTYNGDGLLATSKDPNGNLKTYTYDGGAYPQSIDIQNGDGSNINGVSHKSYFSYDDHTGLLKSTTDPNGQTTSYSYDAMGRITDTVRPDVYQNVHGETKYCYNLPTDSGNVNSPSGCSNSTGNSVSTTVISSPSPSTSTNLQFDGLGRTVRSTNMDGAHVDSVYDAMGRVYSVTNPYQSISDPTYDLTTYSYDVLGRKLLETRQSDSRTVERSYSGPTVDLYDETRRHWRQTMDGLGRLTDVYEDPDHLNLHTSYIYDALDNLTSVTQSGVSGESSRGRSFKYDPLSRLLWSHNPETGVICYGHGDGTEAGCQADGYDNNGNLKYKTDARSVVTSYSYDSLNRLISKTYSDDVTPAEYYTYDAAPGWMSNLENVVGRLTYSGNAYAGGSSGKASAATFSYDAMGRVKRKWQQTPSISPGGYFAYADYDLAGNMTALTYPDGRRVTQGFDNAGRMSGVGYDKWGNTSIGTSYFSSPSYDPAGHLTGGAIGYSLHYTASYDKQLRLASSGYTDNAPAYLWTKSLSWQANGNLDSEINWINGTKRQYGYDSLNRLTSAVDVVNSSTSTGAPISYPSSGSSSTSSTNVLPNANTIWNSNWGRTDVSVTDNGTTGPDGSMTATVLVAGGGGNSAVSGYLGSLASTYIGTAMTGSVWLRSPDGNKTINIYLVTNFAWGGYQPIYKQITVTPTWQQFSVTSTIPNDITDLQFQIGGGYTYASGEIDVWGARVEPSSSVGSTVTNFLEYSQRLNGFPWSSGGLSVADNAADAPDGTHTAALLTVNANASNAYMLNVIASPAPYSNTTVTTSVWLRVPSGTKTFPLYFQEVGAANAGWVTMQTVTVTTDWQRFSLSGVTQDSLSYLALQIGGDNALQSGQLEVWGAQMELGSSASPYIPTGSQPVSRGANFTNILAYSQLVHQFEWTIAGGSVANNSAVAPDGTNSAATMTPGSGSHDAFVYDVAPMPAMYDGATLTGSVYLRVPSGTLSTNLLLLNNSVVKKAVPITLTTNWQRFTVTDTAIHGLTQLSLQVGGGNTIGEGQPFQIWGAQMEVASTAGPYVATYATPITAGNEYVNLLPFSQQFTPSWWYYSPGDSVQANGATAPDQTQTAAVVTCVPSGHPPNNTCDTYVSNRVPNPALYSGSTVTASVYLRSPGGTKTVNLSVISDGASGHVAPWTQITLTPNWQRYQITATLQNGLTSLDMTIGGGQSFTSGSIEVWGTQIVNGTSAGTYDPTGGNSGPTLGQPGALVPNGLFETYAYDSFGNIKQSGNFTFWQNYDQNNRLIGYQYDAAGNLLADGISNIMTWDAENRIRSANGTTYVYDSEGNRVSKSGAGMTETVYFGGRPIARLEAGKWTDLIYGPMGLLAEVPGTQNGSPSYRLLDHLGTQVATADESGALSSVTDTAPFGQIFTGGSSDPYKFTGKERDVESGLDYFGARYYASTMGRWMSPDWSEKIEAVPYAILSEPQSLNLYSYVGNNPIAHIDSVGHASLEYERAKAVRLAWEQERELVEKTGTGSRPWTAAERAELLGTGRVSGFVGHHINSVNGHPDMAGDPNNIKFVKGAVENLAEHGGNFQNITEGPLIDRPSMMNSVLPILQAIDIGINMIGQYQVERLTGISEGFLGGLTIADPAKAAVTLDGYAITISPTKTDPSKSFTIRNGQYIDSSTGKAIDRKELKGRTFVIDQIT